MSAITRLSQIICLSAITLLIAPTCFISTVPLGNIGVRSSSFSGVLEADLEPGWHLSVASIHNLTLLPSRYLFLDYGTEDNQSLQIRTRDNNNVFVDVTVPYRIKPGEAHLIMKAGNHVLTNNDTYRFQRLAAETTVSVLREDLANLTSSDFYNTDKRLLVAGDTLKVLNEELAPLHLEASGVLVRAVTFRPEYEVQLQAIQLNEQNKLLDRARSKLAAEQQKLDNYNQGTAALGSAREQDWKKRQAELERAYQIGGLDIADPVPGKARAALAALTPEQVTAAKQPLVCVRKLVCECSRRKQRSDSRQNSPQNCSPDTDRRARAQPLLGVSRSDAERVCKGRSKTTSSQGKCDGSRSPGWCGVPSCRFAD